jgi:hypothetical protein
MYHTLCQMPVIGSGKDIYRVIKSSSFVGLQYAQHSCASASMTMFATLASAWKANLGLGYENLGGIYR